MSLMVFELTENHLQLLRRMNVGWQDCETGAPAIDPKRPYGNSSVAKDICEILTGEGVGSVGDERDDLSEGEERAYLEIHRSMETALQIVLTTCTFEPGTYACDKYSREWRRVSEES